jgi:hypothetical protein
MSSISIDSKTYQRLEQYSQRARVSIHAAASDAIENWLDITSDPRLAITALSTIAKTQPDPLANPVPGAPAALPPNVTYINANLGPSARHQDDAQDQPGEAGTDTAEGVTR